MVTEKRQKLKVIKVIEVVNVRLIGQCSAELEKLLFLGIDILI